MGGGDGKRRGERKGGGGGERGHAYIFKKIFHFEHSV